MAPRRAARRPCLGVATALRFVVVRRIGAFARPVAARAIGCPPVAGVAPR